MHDKEKKHYNFNVGILIGLAVIFAGVALLLENIGHGLGFSIWRYWPLLIILVGLSKILQPRQYRHPYAGLFLVGLGTLLQLDQLKVLGDFKIWNLWPVLVIFAGFSIIKGAFFHPCKEDGTAGRKKHTHAFSLFGSPTDMSSAFIDVNVILGGGEYKFASKQSKGGKLSAILGGGEIDLRDSDMEGNEMVLDILIICGGLEIRVPVEWEVVCNASPILGGVENKTSTLKAGKKRIIIKGTIIMGGLEIKN